MGDAEEGCQVPHVGVALPGQPHPGTGNLFLSDGWARYTTSVWLLRGDDAHIIPEAGRGVISGLTIRNSTVRSLDGKTHGTPRPATGGVPCVGSIVIAHPLASPKD